MFGTALREMSGSKGTELSACIFLGCCCHLADPLRVDGSKTRGFWPICHLALQSPVRRQ